VKGANLLTSQNNLSMSLENSKLSVVHIASVTDWICTWKSNLMYM